ncbi:MAG TPA: serine/threonine-protein kinase [Verrucomicrobiota bacterium]|nr:hypothetical protein [Verrucomicrobiales bacterium]HRI15238.1 serine/threonine-protein kinase [Verrucomicrobiota bacterium]
MQDLKPCPTCGQPLPAGALAGFCPACLLAQGAETLEAAPGRAAHFHPPTPEELAKLFPQLQIERLLGAGGMGAVYQARQPALDRRVALKILPASSGSGANFAERFNREARALARLNHPNIVSVHEFGQAGSLHFFIMEFVDGANLRQLERAGRLSSREALQLIPQICDALQYAHDEGVVHRDIKPENVLVDRKGRVKIADFGLAKILDVNPDSSRLTVEGQVMGTPHYMAPEQIERPLAVDHRADIYSLGVVLYEMLTGDLPLGNFSPPSRKVSVDVRFDEVVLRALENDPNRRYQQASEVKSRVETIASTTPPPTPAESSLEQPRFHSWMGFAVVKEVPNRRSIYWRGTFVALAVAFGLLSLVFAYGTAFTGGSILGWFGIVGWPSVVVRLAIAGIMASIGVGFAFNSPRPAEALSKDHPRSLVVPSARQGWRIGRRWTTVTFWVLLWTGFQVHWLMPWLRNRAGESNPARVAVRDSSSGALVAKLPHGGTVELLAVAPADALPNQWWLPDGTPITNATFQVRGPADMMVAGAEKTELAFRVFGLTNQADSVQFDFSPTASVSTGGTILRDGMKLADGWPMRVAWPASTRTGTIRLGYLFAGWRTIADFDEETHKSLVTTLPNDPQWATGFNHMSSDEGGTYVTMVLGPETKQWQTRVVAVDRDGVEHVHQRASGTPQEKSSTWTYTFEGLVKSQVKNILVQVRPVHWVEFRNVALKPRGALAGLSSRHFGPVQKITFDEFLDFDTGRTGSPPETDDKNINPFEITTGLLAWMQQNGYDASAGVDKMETLGVTITDLASHDWETLTPEALIQRLQASGRYPPDLKPGTDPTSPATYGFRTREGGTGLLQLLAVGDPKIGATVRFKLVNSPPVP